MNEDDIRPQPLRRANAELRRADLARVLASAADFVAVSCPACGGDRPIDPFHKDGFAFVRCALCATVYISPRPPFDSLMTFYTTAASVRHWWEVIFPRTEANRRAHLFGPRARQLAALCSRLEITTGTLIDVGAGFGTFCEEVRALGGFDEVLAVEVAAGMAAACRQKGFRVIEAAVERVALPAADVITAFELIEHLFEPRRFVESCAAALRPGGLLLLTTPNVLGFEVLALGPRSRTFGGPEHLNYFHAASLGRLLTDCGFAVAVSQTPGALDAELVRQEVRAGTLELQDPFLRQVLLEDWSRWGTAFQQFLAGFGWSSHLSVAAIRR